MKTKTTFEEECKNIKDSQRTMLKLAKVLASFNDKEIFIFMNLCKRFDDVTSDSGYELDLQKFKKDLIKIYWKSHSDIEYYVINNYELKAYRLWNIYDILLKSECMEPQGVMSGSAYYQIAWFCMDAFRKMNDEIGSNIDIKHIYTSD